MKEDKDTKAWWSEGLTFFVRISAWIAGPVIGGLFLGRYIDRRLDSAPWGFVIVIGLAFIISCIGIAREGISYMKKIQNKHNGGKSDDK